MTERMKKIGGRMKIETSAAAGTTILLETKIRGAK